MALSCVTFSTLLFWRKRHNLNGLAISVISLRFILILCFPFLVHCTNKEEKKEFQATLNWIRIPKKLVFSFWFVRKNWRQPNLTLTYSLLFVQSAGWLAGWLTHLITQHQSAWISRCTEPWSSDLGRIELFVHLSFYFLTVGIIFISFNHWDCSFICWGTVNS